MTREVRTLAEDFPPLLFGVGVGVDDESFDDSKDDIESLAGRWSLIFELSESTEFLLVDTFSMPRGVFELSTLQIGSWNQNIEPWGFCSVPPFSRFGLYPYLPPRR
jgi:hypothetical protein